MNLQAGVDEERDAADDRAKVCRCNFAGIPDGIEHGLRGRQRKRQLLHRRGSRLLQMIGAHVGRVPLRHGAAGEQDGVLDQPQRRFGWKHVGAAREIFLDDVVLDRARQLGTIRPLLVGSGDVKREQPCGRRVDGHGGVHLLERDARQQRAHVTQMRHRHTDLADFAAREFVVGVVAGLCRQIERDRQAGLALGKVLAIKLVGLRGGRVTRIGADQPGLIAYVVHRIERAGS